VHCLGGFCIERERELLTPIKREARTREFVIAIARAFPMTRNIGCVRSDLVSR
jgi:hypothetical protein